MAKRITEKLLIEKLTTFVEQHHQAPTAKEFGHHTAIRNFFGSYTKFLESQGLSKVKVTEHYMKIELAEKLHAFVTTHQRAPKASEFGYRYALRDYYDSYYAFLKAHGYEALYDPSLERIPRAKPNSKKKPPKKIKPKKLTKEDLIVRLHAFVHEHGRIPFSTEFGYLHIVNKHFGTYNHFVRSEGFQPNFPGKNKPLPKEELVKKLHNFISTNNRVPKQSDFGQYNQIKKLYGNFNAFLLVNGYEPVKRKQTPKKGRQATKKHLVTKTFLINKLARLVRDYDRTPTSEEMGHEKPIKKYFGSYSAFLVSQGYSSYGDITRTALEQKLEAFVDEHKRIPTVKEFGYASPIQRFYCNYTEFLKANGYVVPKKKQSSRPKKTITSAFLKDKLNKFVEENGRVPTTREFGYRYFVTQLFGSYTAFVRGQGYKPNIEFLSKEELEKRLRSAVETTGRVPKYYEFGHRGEINKLFGSYEVFVQSLGYEAPARRTVSTESLVGKRFGRLLVVSQGEMYRGGTSWNCQCDCGNSKNNVPRGRLTSKQISSCGCLYKEMPHLKKYLVEDTRLTALQGKATRASKTGVCGVVLNTQGKKYCAQIRVKGNYHYLGSFENFADAVAARKAAEEKYFAPILEKYKDRLQED